MILNSIKIFLVASHLKSSRRAAQHQKSEGERFTISSSINLLISFSINSNLHNFLKGGREAKKTFIPLGVYNGRQERDKNKVWRRI